MKARQGWDCVCLSCNLGDLIFLKKNLNIKNAIKRGNLEM